jgi:DNA-binding winged helix-turn-helix (wHTH) protein/Tol biopolymer transport system component
VVHFGAFELDLSSGELRKHGVRMKLQARSFQLLKALLEAPGAVVTREELRRRLWPDDTFVDFESGLNTAMNRLRLALGDSSENPRFIETLARTGYRFIFPIEAGPPESPVPAAPSARLRAHWLLALGVCAAVIASAAVLWFRWPGGHEMSFRQLTFRRGNLRSARFAPDGHTILYTAQWEAGPRQIYLTSTFSPESRPLGFRGMSLAAVSRKGELALLRSDGTMNVAGGTLFRVPLNGGAPLEVDRNITGADWLPDAKLVVARAAGGANQLEFPIGKVVHRTSGYLGNVRVSPNGDAVAFFEHPVRHDDSGSVRLVRTDGSQQVLSEGWSSAAGLAWHPSGREIWFTATRQGATRSLWAVNRSGKVRPLAQAPGILTLLDVAPDGRALVTRDTRRLEMAGRIADEPVERSISWLDWSRVQKVSADGGLILFDESGEGAGDHHVIYIHRTADGSTVRVGEGRAMDLSPDGASVLALGTKERTRFRLLSLAGGMPRELPPSGLEYQWARFFPDGQRLLVYGSEPGKGLRLYVQSTEAQGRPSPLTPEGAVRYVAISPDGGRVAVLSARGELAVFPVGSGEPQILSASEPLAPLHWSRSGAWLYVQHMRSYWELPARVSRLHLPSGQLHPWKELVPADRMGVTDITGIVLSGDERSYVYSYRRTLSELFLATGL